MGVINDSDLDGSIVMQRVADANSFEAIKNASILGQQVGFDTGVEEEGYGFFSYLHDSFISLGSVEYLRDRAVKSYYTQIALHDAARNHLLSNGHTNFAKALDAGIDMANYFGFSLANHPVGHVDGEDPIATQEWIAGEFEWAHPRSQGAMVQLFEAGELHDGMKKDEFRQLVAATNETNGRVEAMAGYNAGWGEPRKLLVDLLVMPFDPLNVLFGVGKARRVGRVAAAGTALAPVLRKAGAQTTAAIVAKDAAQKHIAAFLARKTLMARVSQTAITSSKGAAMFGGFTLASKVLGDIGTNNINNHPGLDDELDVFLGGAGMGALLFGAFSGFAQVTGFTNTMGMKIPAVKRWAESGGVKWIDSQLKSFTDSYDVRKINQEGRTVGEAAESLGDEYISLKDSLKENYGVLGKIAARSTAGVSQANAVTAAGGDSLVIALYREVKIERAAEIAKLKKEYAARGIKLTVAEHPSQAAADSMAHIEALLIRAKADLKSLGESGIRKPNLLNVFSNIDAVNSWLASNRVTDFLGGGESRLLRSKGNVMGVLKEVIHGSSEITGRDANVMKRSGRSAQAVRDVLEAALQQHKIETIRAFKDSTKRNATNAELDSVTTEIERVIGKEGTKFGGTSTDYLETPEWKNSTDTTPEIKAMAAAHIKHFRAIGVQLKALGLVPAEAPAVGALSGLAYIQELLKAGIPDAKLKKFKFKATDSASDIRARVLKLGYFAEDGGGIYFPRSFVKALISEDGAGFQSAMIKQFEYERANIDANDPINSQRASFSVLVRSWKDNAGPGGVAERTEILRLLNDKNFEFNDGGTARKFNADDLKLTASEFDDAIHSSLAGDLIKRDDFGFSGVLGSYERAQMSIWKESALESFKDHALVRVENTSEQQRGQAANAVVTPDNLKLKTFRRGIVPELQKFIMKDPETILNRYAATIHGEIAVAAALQDPANNIGLLFYEDGAVRGRAPRNSYELDVAMAQFEADFNVIQLMAKSAKAKKSILDAREHIIHRQIQPLRQHLKRLVGQQHYVSNMAAEDAMPWTSRVVRRLLTPVVGGSMVVSNVLDATYQAVESLHPRNIQSFAASMTTMIPWLKTLSKENRMVMIETLGMLGEQTGWLQGRRALGVGREARGTTGFAKQATEAIDFVGEFAARSTYKSTGLEWLNRFTRRSSTIVAWKDTVFRAKALRRAVDKFMVDPEVIAAAVKGLPKKATAAQKQKYTESLQRREDIIGPILSRIAREEGLSAYEMARLSKTGITYHNVIQFTDDLYKHGRDWHTNTPVNSRVMADFLKENRQVVFDFGDALPQKGLDYASIVEGIQHDVRHYYNVTPTVLTTSPKEDQNQLLRIINHLSSFLSAYSAQRIRPLSQMGRGASAAQTAGAFIGAWMVMAAQRHVSGQMSFEESIQELHENPLASFYATAGQGGMFGAMHRVAGILDAGGIGPAQILGVKYTGGATGAAQRDRTDYGGTTGPKLDITRMLAQALGPGFRQLINVGEGTFNSLVDGMSGSEQKMLSRSAPLQNHILGRGINYLFDDALFWMTDATRRRVQGGRFPR